jgi:hypothetical protein
MNMHREISERCGREIFFMHKEMPSVKQDIDDVNNIF